MSSVSHIISTIKNLKNGKTTDDKSISDSQWLYILDYYRAILIRQQIQKGQSINENCVQELLPSKITLTQNPKEKYELYTNNLPKAIELHKGLAYTFVGTEGGLSYQRTTYNKSQWDSQSKYIGKLSKWYMLGSRMYITHHSTKLKLNIQGVFERPLDVIVFNDLLDDMNPFSWEYPMSSTMIDTVIKMIVDSEIRLSLLVPKDNLNDGRDGE